MDGCGSPPAWCWRGSGRGSNHRGSRVPCVVYRGILRRMAKVMVSMPEELLSEVDAEANRLGTTRSAVLRQFADSALRERRSDRAAAMRALLADAGHYGGEAAERVKSSRPAV